MACGGGDGWWTILIMILSFAGVVDIRLFFLFVAFPNEFDSICRIIWFQEKRYFFAFQWREDRFAVNFNYWFISHSLKKAKTSSFGCYYH